MLAKICRSHDQMVPGRYDFADFSTQCTFRMPVSQIRAGPFMYPWSCISVTNIATKKMPKIVRHHHQNRPVPPCARSDPMCRPDGQINIFIRMYTMKHHNKLHAFCIERKGGFICASAMNSTWKEQNLGFCTCHTQKVPCVPMANLGDPLYTSPCAQLAPNTHAPVAPINLCSHVYMHSGAYLQ